MTYHVLARKWRPQTFSDLVGQTHVVKALTFALSHHQVHHAYLLTGTRGVGKTSIARIFAKSLNCETKGISANPCGECESCQEIKAGKFVDLIEVDAASRTGVEETRELIDSVSYLPTKGRFKVYLIDEVHMFSKSSFNALLKTLEEPPEYVKFILATTDPDKLPITILSRCLQFNLKSLTQKQICQHLSNICQAESITYDEDALKLLADAGDGSMRDTLSMTDQAIAYGQGELSLAAVTEILGTIQPADIEAILFAIATNNPNQLSTALHRLDNYEVDARAFLIEIMKRLQRMAWAKEGIVEQLSPALLSAVGDIPKPLLHLWYDIAEKALPNLAVSGNPREAVTMALLRMLAFVPNDWLPRHRTVLDESLRDGAAEAQKEKPPQQASSEKKNSAAKPADRTQREKQTKVKAAQTPAKTAETTVQPATSIKQVHATPIACANDLAQAEENFSKYCTTAKSTDKSAAEPADKPLVKEPKASVSEQNGAGQQAPDTVWQAAWQLSQESSLEPPPSQAEIDAVMLRGRDIAPPSSENNKIPTLTPRKENSARHADGAMDSPPWQDQPSDGGEKADACQDKPAKPNDTEAAAGSSGRLSEFCWETLVYQLGLSDYTLQFVSLGILRVAPTDNGVMASLDLLPKHQVMVTDDSLAELQTALQQYFQQNVKVEVNLTQIEQATPAEIRQQQQVQQQQALLETFRQEPMVQTILQTFAGKIIEKTVKRTQ